MAFIVLILLAILSGTIYSCPDAYFIKAAGHEYKGIGPIGFIDETLYLGRINAAQNGKGSLGNPAIYEHRNDPTIMPPLSESIEGGFGKLLGLNAAQTDMLSTFLLPAILFALIALLAYRISGLLYGALLVAFAELLGMHFFSRLFIFSGKLFNSDYSLPLWFARPITPQMHFVFFVLAIYFIFRSIQKNKIVFSIMGGAFLGTLFYVSVFYWVYVFAVLGILFVIYSSKREIAPLKIIAIVCALALLISVPYWMENLKTMRDQNYELLLYRYNIAFTHRPIFPVGAIALLLMIFLSRKMVMSKVGEKAYLFMSSLPIAMILTLNQQVITGKLFKQSHWTTYTGKFALILCGVIIGSILMGYLGEKNRIFKISSRLIAVLFVVILVVHGISMQMNYHRSHFQENLDMQKMAGAIEWLKDNTGSGDVVLPSPRCVRLSEILPIYTNNYVYYSEPFFCMSLIPSEETRYRMLASYRLFGLSLEDAMNHPYSWDGAIFLTSDTNRERTFVRNERIKLMEEYDAMLKGDGLKLANMYKVDYLLADDSADDEAIKQLMSRGLKKVFDDGRYSVIKAGGIDG